MSTAEMGGAQAAAINGPHQTAVRFLHDNTEKVNQAINNLAAGGFADVFPYLVIAMCLAIVGVWLVSTLFKNNKSNRNNRLTDP